MEERFSGVMFALAQAMLPDCGPIFETCATDLKREAERIAGPHAGASPLAHRQATEPLVLQRHSVSQRLSVSQLPSATLQRHSATKSFHSSSASLPQTLPNTGSGSSPLRSARSSAGTRRRSNFREHHASHIPVVR